MTLKNAISVRFEEDIHLRLEQVAKRAGIKPADLIRQATQTYMDKVEAEGQIVIPLAPKRKAAEGTHGKDK